MIRQRPPATLLKLLTLPFLAVVLALAAVVGWLSYRSAQSAVNETAQQWLGASLQRVGDEIERQQLHVDAVLQATASRCRELPCTDPFVECAPLAEQLQLAASVLPREGTWVGWTGSDGRVLRAHRPGPVQPDNGSPPPSKQAQSDPAPWAQAAMRAQQPSWLPVQWDPASSALTATRIWPAKGASGWPDGVLAASVSLLSVQHALAALKLPPQGVAFVVDRNGFLVGSSSGPVTRSNGAEAGQRIHVQELESELMRTAYDRALPMMGQHGIAQPGHLVVNEPGLPPLVSSYGRLADANGHDWAVIVAAPREVFTANSLETVVRTAAATLAAMAVILLLAAWIRRQLARDVIALSRTLKAVADGDLDTPPEPMHSAEMDRLRDALCRTQLRIRNDRQVGLANRESVLTHLHDRLRPARRHNDAPLLALLLIDLNRFSEVNRVHGHEVGDRVLQTIGKRLRQTVRDTDLVARWTSDEFVVVLNGVASRNDADRVREQVELVLRDPVDLGNGQEAVEIDGTAGLALVSVNTDLCEPDSLLRAAEADLAQRKPPRAAEPKARR